MKQGFSHTIIAANCWDLNFNLVVAQALVYPAMVADCRYGSD